MDWNSDNDACTSSDDSQAGLPRFNVLLEGLRCVEPCPNPVTAKKKKKQKQKKKTEEKQSKLQKPLSVKQNAARSAPVVATVPVAPKRKNQLGSSSNSTWDAPTQDDGNREKKKKWQAD